ncbi:MAG: hypothetical protein Q7J70_06750 [Thermodesulfovibrionales bacterium]|nr:hypothetical protein [Thermodesulfovibrionales bacterium]
MQEDPLSRISCHRQSRAEPPRKLWAMAFGEKASNELKTQKLLASLIKKKAKDSDIKKGRKAESDTGILTAQGAFGNLPAGEVYLPPLEGTANGRLVLEFAPTRQLKSPVTLTVKSGFVEAVSGDEEYSGYLGGKPSAHGKCKYSGTRHRDK